MDSKLSVEPPKAKSDREANSYISLLIKKRALHRYHTKNFIDLDIEKKERSGKKSIQRVRKKRCKNFEG